MKFKSKILGVAILVFSLAIFLYGTWVQWEPEPNVDCAFSPRSDQTLIQLGEFKAPIQSIELSGYLEDPFEGTLYDFSGQAFVQISGIKRRSDASGSMFLSEQKEINGLVLNFKDRGFGREGLKVVTLNETGMLDSSSAVAYAFTSKDFKLSHPLDFSCKLGQLYTWRNSEGFR